MIRMRNLRIFTLTWNVNAQNVANELDFGPLFSTISSAKEIGDDDNKDKVDLTDLVVVSFQEVNSRLDRYLINAFVDGEDPWTQAVRIQLAKLGYLKLKTIRLLGTVLSVFCLRQHLLHIRNMESQYTRLHAFVGLKGCVSVRLTLFGVSMCFVNSHLTALDEKLEMRIEEYDTIISEHTFKQADTTHILYHDYIFWMGDLNFRLEQDSLAFQDIVEAIEQKNFATLLTKDQLTRARRQGQAFHELSEKLPTFPPTYKFILGTMQYDPRRRPAWTDRILYRVNALNYDDVNLTLEPSNYKSHTDQQYRISDHLPVSSTFAVRAFDPELAITRRIDDYAPLVIFKFPGAYDDDNVDHNVGDEENKELVQASTAVWFVHEEGNIKYMLKPNAGLYTSTWDYIALYHADFTSLDNYVVYCWASTCRRTGVVKSATIPAENLCVPGSYVLVYITAKSSILGMSQPFTIGYRPGRVEVGQEANENDEL